MTDLTIELFGKPIVLKLESDYLRVRRWKGHGFKVEFHYDQPIKDWWHASFSSCGVEATSTTGGGRDETVELAVKSLENRLETVRWLFGGV